MNSRIVVCLLSAVVCALPLAQAGPVEEALTTAQYRILANFEEVGDAAVISFAVDVTIAQNEPSGVTAFAVYRRALVAGEGGEARPDGEEERLGEVVNLGSGRIYEFADTTYDRTKLYLYNVRAVYFDHDSDAISNPVGNWPSCTLVKVATNPPAVWTTLDCGMPLPIVGAPPCSPIDVDSRTLTYELRPGCL